jgi:glycosyltransferase involved in cell wall biosynthesis
MDKILVSIIIPSFNSQPTIKMTVLSCLQQNFKQLEIIIVDDHSQDKSTEIIQSLIKSDPRVKLLTNPQKGAQTARNYGLSTSKGNYIKFLDADDMISPDLIQNQVNMLHGHPEHISHCKWAHFDKKPADCQYQQQRTDQSYKSAEDFLTDLWRGNMYPLHSWLIPRELLKDNCLWDETLIQNQDGEFFARLTSKAKGILFSSGTAFYRKPKSGHTSSKKGIPQAISQICALHSYRKICLKLGDPPNLVRAYNYQVFCVAYRIATTFEEAPALPAALSLFASTAGPPVPRYPTALMTIMTKVIGVRSSLKFRCWLTKVLWRNSSTSRG